MCSLVQVLYVCVVDAWRKELQDELGIVNEDVEAIDGDDIGDWEADLNSELADLDLDQEEL